MTLPTLDDHAFGRAEHLKSVDPPASSRIEPGGLDIVPIRPIDSFLQGLPERSRLEAES